MMNCISNKYNYEFHQLTGQIQLVNLFTYLKSYTCLRDMWQATQGAAEHFPTKIAWDHSIDEYLFSVKNILHIVMSYIMQTSVYYL